MAELHLAFTGATRRMPKASCCCSLPPPREDKANKLVSLRGARPASRAAKAANVTALNTSRLDVDDNQSGAKRKVAAASEREASPPRPSRPAPPRALPATRRPGSAPQTTFRARQLDSAATVPDLERIGRLFLLFEGALGLLDNNYTLSRPPCRPPRAALIQVEEKQADLAASQVAGAPPSSGKRVVLVVAERRVAVIRRHKPAAHAHAAAASTPNF